VVPLSEITHTVWLYTWLFRFLNRSSRPFAMANGLEEREEPGMAPPVQAMPAFSKRYSCTFTENVMVALAAGARVIPAQLKVGVENEPSTVPALVVQLGLVATTGD